MATPPAGKKPAPKKAPAAKKPAAKKKAAGAAATTLIRKPTARKPPGKPAAKPKPVKARADLVAALNPRQQRFVDEYLVDLNATQAAIRAGYSAKTANEQGSELLAKLSVQAAISEARQRQQDRTQITADRVLVELMNIAVADPRDLVEVKVGCCRHCYGEGFKYQRTLAEFNHDRGKWLESGKDPAEFDDAGGVGFNPLRAPHGECPNCGGDGAARVSLKDTRKVNPAALALYAGAKQTKEGIEVKMHSKMDALEKLARHLGVYERDNQQKSDPLAALLSRIANGNSNGFKPVADDPEMPTPAGTNSLMPRQEIDDEGTG